MSNPNNEPPDGGIEDPDPPEPSEVPSATPAAAPAAALTPGQAIPLSQFPFPGAAVLTPGLAGLPNLGMQLQFQVWQGQFPPPEAIERYEAVHPGAFGRLITLAENNQAAQIEAQADARRRFSGDVRWGQFLGFAISAAAIGGAVLIALSHPSGAMATIAVALLGVPVMSVGVALVNSARAKPVQQVVATLPAAAAPAPAQHSSTTPQG